MAKQRNDFMIHPLPVLEDNIVWIWVEENNAVVVDPSITEPVESWLKANNLFLKAILQTHHHFDHIGGTEGLLKSWPGTEVIASKDDLNRIPFQTTSVSDGDEILLMGFPLQVFQVKGHTNTHLAYFLKDHQNNSKSPALFCGDTLFAGGCGRLFEGSSAEMYLSLKRINTLPLNTQIFCAHEYTLSNLRWANELFPEDIAIKKRLQKVIKTREDGLTTLPSTLHLEQMTNLFLRARSLKEFSFLRHHKDHWTS